MLTVASVAYSISSGVIAYYDPGVKTVSNPFSIPGFIPVEPDVMANLWRLLNQHVSCGW